MEMDPSVVLDLGELKACPAAVVAEGVDPSNLVGIHFELTGNAVADVERRLAVPIPAQALEETLDLDAVAVCDGQGFARVEVDEHDGASGIRREFFGGGIVESRPIRVAVDVGVCDRLLVGEDADRLVQERVNLDHRAELQTFRSLRAEEAIVEACILHSSVGAPEQAGMVGGTESGEGGEERRRTLVSLS